MFFRISLLKEIVARNMVIPMFLATKLVEKNMETFNSFNSDLPENFHFVLFIGKIY